MPTRIEIRRSYDRTKKVRNDKPIFVEDLQRKASYCTSGAILSGPSEVFYKPYESPRTYIQTSYGVSPVEITADNPVEDKTGKITYVNILLMTIDGNRGKKVPERYDSPRPCLLKRRAGRTAYGHHIRILGPSTIICSMRKPIRPMVYIWIETASDVECTKTGECFCSSGFAILERAVWQRFCPLLLGHRN
jgi:hypothetical protein